jgi:hypothetical protein
MARVERQEPMGKQDTLLFILFQDLEAERRWQQALVLHREFMQTCNAIGPQDIAFSGDYDDWILQWSEEESEALARVLEASVRGARLAIFAPLKHVDPATRLLRLLSVFLLGRTYLAACIFLPGLR